MKFVVRTKKMDPDAPSEIVKANTWMDARAVMAIRLQTDPQDLECVLTTDNAIENVEVDQVGSDAGSKPNKHLRVREREKGTDREASWGKWRRWP